MISSLSLGVISDTHGTLLPGVAEAFKNASPIIHAGDIDKPQVLERLQQIAPVTAVRGNMDSEVWFSALPTQITIALGKLTVTVIHDLSRLRGYAPPSAGPSLVISGHTHKQQWTQIGDTYYLNPGSAYSPRGDKHPSVAIVTMDGAKLNCKFVRL